MSTSLTSTGSILVKNVGTNLQGDSLDAGASLSIKRKVNDITYSARITEATIKSVGSFKGAWVQLAKPLGPKLNGILTYDLGLKAVTAQLSNSNKFSNGRQLDLGMLYKEKNNEVVLTTSVKPHKQHRLTATVVPSTRALMGTYIAELGSWVIQPTYDFNKKTTVVGVSKKLSGSTLSTSYAFKDKGASVAWNRKPFTVLAKIKVGREGVLGKPTLGLTVNKEFVVKDAAAQKSAQDAKAQAAATGKQAMESGKKAVESGKKAAAQLQQNVKAAVKKEKVQEKTAAKNVKAAVKKEKVQEKATAKKAGAATAETKNCIQVKLDEFTKAVKDFCDSLQKGPEPKTTALPAKRK